MLTLKKNPTLKDIQKYVAKLEKERHFDHDDIRDKCVLLGEELGELFKAIRKKETTIRLDHNSKCGSIDEELADIICIICTIANRQKIDLETAFRNKEKINKKRTWK
jgi:NTP pyrophosphatase (non-canonical NTP hydrolase)